MSRPSRVLGALAIAAVLASSVLVSVSLPTAAAVGLGSFSIANASGPEGTGGSKTLDFVVTISQANLTDVSVDYDTSDGTAKAAGGDYTATSDTLVIEAGETTGTISIPLGTDSASEPNETFTVTLSNPETGMLIADGTATGSIQNDDTPAPSFSIDNVTHPEGDVGGTDATFTVTLSASTTLETTVEYTTSSGSASAGTDYGVTSGTLTFDPGDTSEEIDVSVAGDELDEANETFFVTLSNPDDASIGDGSGTGTITDDDDPPAVTVEDAAIGEGNSGTTTLTFTAELSAESGRTATVDFATGAGALNPATAGVDYASKSGTVTFVPGDTSESITITVNGDTLDELDETFSLNLTNPLNLAIEDASAVGTITDDEPLPAVSVVDTSTAEGNTGTANKDVTVTLSVPSGLTVTVDYATSEATATEPEDYTTATGTVTFAPGQTSKTFPVAIQGDLLDEPNETIGLTLSNPTNATVADGTGVLTITDDDATPSLSIDDRTVTESDSGFSSATFTVSLSAASGQDVTVNVSTADGTAAAGEDYAPISNQLVTIEAGETSATVNVNAFGDGVDEADETATVNLSGAVHATISDPSGLLTISDDDEGPTISVDDVAELEGTGAGSTTITFTISLSEASEQTVTVAYATQNGTAVAPGDYTSRGGTLTFSPDETSEVLEVNVVRDAFAEAAETFTLALSTPTNASLADASGTGTINNDDGPAATLSIADDTTPESDDAVFTITLSEAAAQDVTFQVATSPDEATSPADYDGTGATKTITAGNTSTTFTVPVVDDDTDEPSEDFNVAISNASNAGIDDGTAVGTITDNDDPPSISIADLSVAEGDAGTSDASFGVTLSRPTTNTVTVTATTTTGTANSADFTTTTDTVTFVPLDTSETFDVPVVGDTKAEIDEAFTVALSAPSQASIGDGTATGTITEDDGGGTFTPVTPARILDTRNGTGRGGNTNKVGPGQTIVVDVTGVGGVPAGGVDAVVINTTVTGPTATSFLAVTPNGGSSTSNLNFTAGQTVPNLVTVPVGTGGNIRIFNASGSTHIVGDVVGWYASDSSTTPASHYQNVAPARILDTRDGTGRGGNTSKVGPGQTIVLDVTGVGTVPANGVAGVVINTTVTGPTANSFLTVTPTGGSSTSNLNFTPNQTVANLVSVPVGPDGNIRIRNATGSTHVVGDVVGWYTTPGTKAASVFEPVAPARILDTRDGTGRGGNTSKVGPGQTIVVDISGVGGVPATGIAGAVLNTTVTQPTAAGFLTVTPNGGSATSTLNFQAGQTVPNLVHVSVGIGGNIRIFNSAGSSHILADVVGWFTSPAT